MGDITRIIASTLPDFTVITGHYGVGKTNLALNLARSRAQQNGPDSPVLLIDLDIVNPYFRSSDFLALLQAEGIRLIAPTFARTTLESPSLPADMAAAFSHKGTVILDVGGDASGATVLGRYAHQLQARAAEGDYAFLSVVNRYRSLSTKPEEACALLREIEAACGLRATGIVNNSHLQAETTLELLVSAASFGLEVARLCTLPLLATTVPEALAAEAAREPRLTEIEGELWPLQTLVTTPWQKY
jgi:hypothetical protein